MTVTTMMILVYPWSTNLFICDGKDTNCDGTYPDMAAEADGDGDGWPNCNDCKQADPAINPGVTEGPPGSPICSDGKDNDCDSDVDLDDQTCLSPCIDEDGDGYYSTASDPSCAFPLDDCNDNAFGINPGITDDSCDTVDNNCSGTADDEFGSQPTSCGVGECGSTGTATCDTGDGVITDTCTPGTPQTEGPFGDATCTGGLDEDCDGTFDTVSANPDADCQPCTPSGVSETICNGDDDDCDGQIDEDYVSLPTTCGVGECGSSGITTCDTDDGVIADTCTPGTPVIEDGAPTDPICNDGLDNDCDTIVDECKGCNDQDSDGWGESSKFFMCFLRLRQR